MRMHEYFKDPEPGFSTSTTRGKMAEFNYMKPPKINPRFVESLKSSIPLLADHYRNSKTHSNAALPNSKLFHRTFEQFQVKKGLDLSSVFHQSEYQNRLRNNTVLDKFKAPASHYSFNKVNPATYSENDRGRFSAAPTIQNGRNRMFHSSQIF